MHRRASSRACKVDVYLDQQNIDTMTPMGKLIFQVRGAFAEFERSMIRQRINLGIERARKHRTKSGAPIGRAPIEDEVRANTEALAKGMSYRAAAVAAGTSLGSVQRVAASLRPFGEPSVEPVAA
jgi:DNA invertase Pin-like site-specific DNA recombinase